MANHDTVLEDLTLLEEHARKTGGMNLVEHIVAIKSCIETTAGENAKVKFQGVDITDRVKTSEPYEK